MDEFFSQISKDIDVSGLDLRKPWVIEGVGETLLDVIASILAKKLGKDLGICIFDRYEEGLFDRQKLIHIQNGDRLDIGDLISKLNLERVNRVWKKGEVSVLGDTVSFWPVELEEVVRVSFFGNNIESISLLEPSTRMLKENIDHIDIIRNDENVRNIVRRGYGNGIQMAFFFREGIDDDELSFQKVDIGVRALPSVNQRYINKILESYKKQGYVSYGIVQDARIISGYPVENVIKGEINRGFVLSRQKIVVVSTLEVSGGLDLSLYDEGLRLSEDIFKQIRPGDYIVHEDHGVGIYEQLVDQMGELYLDIHYAGNDRLLIPLKSAYKITKYVGAAKAKPRLTGLSSGVWTRVKRKAKEDAQKMAKELVSLYAIRSITKATPLIDSENDIKELNTFIKHFKYQDTEDQQIITNDIVSDLKRGMPMDRLIVGDVGFGKTELAARASFIAVNQGKQVAILAPTTVLAQQHLDVFRDRFREYPVRIEMLSRIISKKEREKILQAIADKKVDIVIGTHAILSDKVNIPNLALLIVDEEQRFGVAQKELIKKKRVEINVLSLTATPIPRTLNMAMSGIRDLSILASVPQGRLAIKNVISKFSWEKVVEAITFEKQRGGQIFYLHNRIKDLEKIKKEIVDKIPEVTIEIAHGQMGGVALTRTMKRFAKGEFDVLLCSTIIENGIDLPRVNTLIIDDAHRYGLSQLYQIRGRIGRSDILAHAYIMYPQLLGDARLRLDALEEAHSLGAGFILSSRDLEIRGAGNILGRSQSGAINSVGYALYSQMFSQSIRMLQDRSY